MFVGDVVFRCVMGVRSWTRIAKKPNVLHTNVHIALQIEKSQSIFCERIMATLSKYVLMAEDRFSLA